MPTSGAGYRAFMVDAPVSSDEERVKAAHDAEVDDLAMLSALDDTIAAIEAREIPYVLMGGIASANLGRPRWTHDIDLFVRPPDAREVLVALAERGFETEETFPDWLFKGTRDGQLVDVIFRSAGDIYLDDEMLARARTCEWRDRTLRLIPPEDLLVIKAVVHDEPMPRHWHDALALVALCDLDWEYLIMRSRRGVRRVLSLLLYAQSNDIPVPVWVLRRLYALVDEEAFARGG